MSQPDAPRIRSSRVAAITRNNEEHDPYPLDPLLEEVLPPSPTNVGVLFGTYLAFLSRRHLHCYILYLALACPASACFFRLEIGALSMPALAWFCFLRPKIHASSKAEAKEFYSNTGSRGSYFMDMAAVYVAPTGVRDEMGCDIMGLNPNQFIKRYCCFVK
jgi:hypothetical protein